MRAGEAGILGRSTIQYVSVRGHFFLFTIAVCSFPLIVRDNLASVCSSLKKPAFMLLDGVVFGSGSAFLAAPLVATTGSTTFAVPDVLIGFFPDCGILYPSLHYYVLLHFDFSYTQISSIGRGGAIHCFDR